MESRILGPVKPISVEALRALDAIALILLKTPRDEWEFVLLQAKSKAEEGRTFTPDIGELIQSESIKNILDSFRRLGGNVKINKNKIILDGRIIPTRVVKTYAALLRQADKKNQLKISAKENKANP